MQPDQPMAHTPFTPLGKDNRRSRSEARKSVLTQTPVLEEVLARLDRDIKALNNIETISDKVLLDETKFMNTVAARKIAIRILNEKKIYLQKRIDAVLSS